MDAAPPAGEPEVVDVGLGEEGVAPFDFVAHRQRALDSYQPLVPLYHDFARVVFSILRTCLDAKSIKVHTVDFREKSLESFGAKAAQTSSLNPAEPKYVDPISQITDLAGVRVITYFLSTEEPVQEIIESEFEVVEKTNRSELLQQEERLGYHSIHYLVCLRASRCTLPEYARFAGLIAEIQVRTILQHAWAEIEHDVQYKAVSTIPKEIRRRFMSLAGLLEIADREFQAIEDEDNRLRLEARRSVEEGRLSAVEITADALKSYLDKKFGKDGRISDSGYEWEARLLRNMGFSSLGQVDDAIRGYDDDEASRIIWGNRQGQLTRFECVLIAAMGEEYRSLHPWAKTEDWFNASVDRRLAALRQAGIEIGNYVPPAMSKSDDD